MAVSGPSWARNPASNGGGRTTTTTSAATGPMLFGDQLVESVRDSDDPGEAEAFPFTNATAGSASSITVYVDSGNQATQLVAGLYADHNGDPSSLIASGSLSSPASGAWDTVAIPSTAVQSGTTYWISILGRGGSLNFRDGNGGCKSESSQQSNLTSLPASWQPGLKWTSCPLSAFAGGTAGSGASGSGAQTSTTQTSTTHTTTTQTTTTPTTTTETTTQTTTTPTTTTQTTTTPTTTTQTTTTPTTTTQTTTTPTTTTQTTTTQAPPPPPPSGSPTNTAEPVVSGTVATGDVLLTTNGTWSGSPTSYSYQWQDCAGDGTGCTNIAGATSSTYTVASADTGHTIEALVTATNSNGSATAGAPIVPLIDNFSGSGVDTNVWSVLNQQGDTSNDEQECYEPSQVSEGSSGLTITNVFNATGFACPTGTPSSSACTGACSSSNKHYLSGAAQEINTAFTYGTVVFRARMLGHAGSTWPAVWLLGAACQTSHTAPYTWLSGTSNTALGYFCPWAYDSSDAAEVDIAEGNSGTTSTVLENVFNGNTNHACTSPTISDYSQNFHTYELDWSPGSLVFKIDGKATNCGITGSGVPSHPMFLIINAADQRSPSSGDFPNTMTVSYMHVSH
jgi:hypothetical protein